MSRSRSKIDKVSLTRLGAAAQKFNRTSIHHPCPAIVNLVTGVALEYIYSVRIRKYGTMIDSQRARIAELASAFHSHAAC